MLKPLPALAVWGGFVLLGKLLGGGSGGGSGGYATSSDPSRLPPEIIAFTKACEGLTYEARPDANLWSIGYGNTRWKDGTPVQSGDVILSQQQAEDLMVFWLLKGFDHYRKTIPNFDLMSDGQKAALMSFGYNVGKYWYNSPSFTTISKAVSERPDLVPYALLLYSSSGGKRLLGLVRRRYAEGLLWNGTWSKEDGGPGKCYPNLSQEQADAMISEARSKLGISASS